MGKRLASGKNCPDKKEKEYTVNQAGKMGGRICELCANKRAANSSHAFPRRVCTQHTDPQHIQTRICKREEGAVDRSLSQSSLNFAECHIAQLRVHRSRTTSHLYEHGCLGLHGSNENGDDTNCTFRHPLTHLNGTKEGARSLVSNRHAAGLCFGGFLD